MTGTGTALTAAITGTGILGATTLGTGTHGTILLGVTTIVTTRGIMTTITTDTLHTVITTGFTHQDPAQASSTELSAQAAAELHTPGHLTPEHLVQAQTVTAVQPDQQPHQG